MTQNTTDKLHKLLPSNQAEGIPSHARFVQVSEQLTAMQDALGAIIECPRSDIPNAGIWNALKIKRNKLVGIHKRLQGLIALIESPMRALSVSDSQAIKGRESDQVFSPQQLTLTALQKDLFDVPALIVRQIYGMITTENDPERFQPIIQLFEDVYASSMVALLTLENGEILDTIPRSYLSGCEHSAKSLARRFLDSDDVINSLDYLRQMLDLRWDALSVPSLDGQHENLAAYLDAAIGCLEIVPRSVNALGYYKIGEDGQRLGILYDLHDSVLVEGTDTHYVAANFIPSEIYKSANLAQLCETILAYMEDCLGAEDSQLVASYCYHIAAAAGLSGADLERFTYKPQEKKVRRLWGEVWHTMLGAREATIPKGGELSASQGESSLMISLPLTKWFEFAKDGVLSQTLESELSAYLRSEFNRLYNANDRKIKMGQICRQVFEVNATPFLKATENKDVFLAYLQDLTNVPFHTATNVLASMILRRAYQTLKKVGKDCLEEEEVKNINQRKGQLTTMAQTMALSGYDGASRPSAGSLSVSSSGLGGFGMLSQEPPLPDEQAMLFCGHKARALIAR